MRIALALGIVSIASIAHADPAKTPAPAPTPWRFGVAARAGVDLPTAKLGAMAGATLELDGAATDRLVVAVAAGWTRPSHDGTVDMTTYTIRETELAIGVDAVLRLAPAGERLEPWIGAGPLVQLVRSSETTSLAPGTNTEDSTELGVEAAAGLDLATGPGFAVGDLRFRWTGLDHALTGPTDAGNFALSIGYRLVF